MSYTTYSPQPKEPCNYAARRRCGSRTLPGKVPQSTCRAHRSECPLPRPFSIRLELTKDALVGWIRQYYLFGLPEHLSKSAWFIIVLGKVRVRGGKKKIVLQLQQSQQLLRFTTGSSTNWGRFLVQWDIGLKFTKLHLQRARNEVM